MNAATKPDVSLPAPGLAPAAPGGLAAAPGGARPVREASPREVQEWLRRGEAVVVDVREPDEHARERLAGARLLPLSRFDAERAATWASPRQKLVFHCRGGSRSADACRRAAHLAARGCEIVNLTGGLEACKAAGLAVETDRRAPRVSIMRQVQIVAGGLVLTGSLLAWLVNPAFVGIAGFIGAGLLFAGLTGTCALASVLAALPWNRVASSR